MVTPDKRNYVYDKLNSLEPINPSTFDANRFSMPTKISLSSACNHLYIRVQTSSYSLWASCLKHKIEIKGHILNLSSGQRVLLLAQRSLARQLQGHILSLSFIGTNAPQIISSRYQWYLTVGTCSFTVILNFELLSHDNLVHHGKTKCAACMQQNTFQSFLFFLKTGSCYIALTSLELERNLILIHGTS